MTLTGRCACGKVGLELVGRPFARFFCHCTTCRGIYHRPFADVTAVWSHRVRVVDGKNALAFKHHHWVPSVRRGVCCQCEEPVIGALLLPPSGIKFVPSTIWSDDSALPPPSGHAFYHSRAADIDDDLPKVSGWLGSELSITAWLVRGLFR